MTTRRFNYTGARRIKQRDVEIVVDRDEAGLTFDASYSLADYGLPESAAVIIEAYVEWTLMRFDFGTVGMRRVPEVLALSQFDVADGIKFRLKILGTGDNAGLILAEADKIQPSDLTSREPAKSFIAVRPADLGNVAWRLTFDESQPVLQINERLGDWQSFVRRASIRALVLPEIVRQILREAVELEPPEEDTDAWQRHALKLAPASCGPAPRGDNNDELEEWIDDVVRKFARRHRLWRGMADFVSQGAVE